MQYSYDLFSNCYRELITATGHLQKERETVELLLNIFNISKDADILDAACGTGDLLYYLRDIGYLHLTGKDNSQGMLARAKEILPVEIFSCEDWNQIHEKDQYDLILILSVSLLHAELADLPSIFKNLYQALKPGGILLFDNRQWEVDCQKGLIEPGRPINQRRFIQEFIVKGETLQVADECRYNKGRQIITYFITDQSGNESTLLISYFILETEKLAKFLSVAGFFAIGTYDSNVWPYELIYARR